MVLQRIPSTEGSRRTGTLRTNSSDKRTYLGVGSQGLVSGNIATTLSWSWALVRPIVVQGHLAQAATAVSYH